MEELPTYAEITNLRAKVNRRARLISEHNRQRSCPSMGYDEDAAIAEIDALDCDVSPDALINKIVRLSARVLELNSECERLSTSRYRIAEKLRDMSDKIVATTSF